VRVGLYIAAKFLVMYRLRTINIKRTPVVFRKANLLQENTYIKVDLGYLILHEINFYTAI